MAVTAVSHLPFTSFFSLLVLGTRYKLMKRTHSCAIQWASTWAHGAGYSAYVISFNPLNNPIKKKKKDKANFVFQKSI